MTAFSELHPIVQTGCRRCNDCDFGESPYYGKDVHLCRFHQGMSVGVDEALEWLEEEEG